MRAEMESELQATRCKLERLERLYAMLSRISRCVVRAEDAHELYEAVCRIAVEQGAFACAWVGLLEPGGERVLPMARAGAAVDLGQVSISLADPVGRCPIGAAMAAGKAYLVNDIERDPRLGPYWYSLMNEAAARAMAAFAIRVDGRIVGAFVVFASEPDYFTATEVQLLGGLIDDLAFALEDMRREEKRVAAETKIHYLAYYDTQTGLPGRMLFRERLVAACAAAGDRAVALLAVNLRNYHGVLQVLGDVAGSQMVQTVARRLEILLPTAAVGRVSESEFVVMLENPEGLHLVEETAWRIHAALAEAIPIEGHEVFLDPFVGIALHPRDGSAVEVLKAAQVAGATGPLEAGACCRFFVADMDRTSRQRLELEAALRRALERREFVLYFQPQVDLNSGRVIGAEALLRWQRPDIGLVGPVEFIPLLENTGLIVPVGEWVLEEACRFAKQCQDEGLPSFRMAVNLSACQFQDGDVGALARRALAASGLEARWLELEVTESVVLLNAEAVIRTMNDLKSLGVSHALDDFGTGYSSLSYLQRLPIARIKIDQSFVSHITSNPNDAAIVRAVVGMAHSLGISVIAEGVETEGQLGFLRGLKCEEMQGYYFSRPLPADDFRALLREKRSIAKVWESAQIERTVLVVDDEPNVLSCLRRLLRTTDMRVLTTTSIQEGFNLMAAHQVGVVVCDQRMPEMTGTEFLRRVRELHPGVVRIVLSGYTDLNSVIDAVNRGAIYKFMTKPWEDDALIESLQEAFRLYEMEKENRELSQRLKELLDAVAHRAQPLAPLRPEGG